MRTIQAKVDYTDVLIIGAGAAASRAAYESAAAGADTVMVTKGYYGMAGTSCYRVAETAGFSAAGYADPADSPEQHEKDILKAALGPCSPTLAKIVAENAPAQVRFLESIGVVYQRFQENYLATKGCYASRRRSLKIKGHGEPIVRALKQAILAQEKVRIFENTAALDLIVKDGRCCGACLLSEDGRYTEMRAGAVILGAGGAGQLFDQSLNPVDITGDGYALAFRAGAGLVNMEFMQAGFGVIHPAKTIFNAWIWALNPEITDSDGNQFLNEYIPSGVSMADCVRDHQKHYPFSSRDTSKYLEIAVKSQCNKNKAVFADLRNVKIPEDNLNLKQMWPLTKGWMKQCGIDTDADMLQLTCYAHAINGGVLIDKNTESEIHGLFAVGENAGGAHGADRLGGNMFASGQVFGEIAGRKAAALSRQYRNTETKKSSLTLILDDVSGMTAMEEIREKLRKAMTENMLIIRDESGMKKMKEYIETSIADLRTIRCSSIEELMYHHELVNMLQVAMIMTDAAMMRRESRGSHYRSDYPEMGDSRWEQAIKVSRRSDGSVNLEFTVLK